MLVALVPTILMTGVGIVLLVVGDGSATTLISGVLVLDALHERHHRLHPRLDLRRQGRVARARAERLRLGGLARAAHAGDVDPPVASKSLRDNRLGRRRSRRRCSRCSARETDRLEELVGKRARAVAARVRAHAFARERVDVERRSIEEAIAAFDALTLPAADEDRDDRRARASR